MNWRPVERALTLWPDQIGGRHVRIVTLDDQSDAQRADEAIARLCLEEKADMLVQFSLSGPAFAAAKCAQAFQVPHLTMSPIVSSTEQADWTFRLSPPPGLLAKGLLAYAAGRGLTRLGYFGTDDNYGRSWLAALPAAAAEGFPEIVTSQSYLRAETEAGPQAAALAAKNLDAVIIGGPGSACLVPHMALRQAGFGGPILQTYGADMRQLAVTGSPVLGPTAMVTSPGPVSHLLPAESAVGHVAEDFKQRYQDAFNEPLLSQAALATQDALCILDRIVPRTRDMQAGTADIRHALRQALFSERDIVTTNGHLNYTPADRFGFGDNGQIVIELQDGTWTMPNHTNPGESLQ